jgi:AsmA-like C-terminal region
MKSKILKITGVTLLVLVTFVWSAPWLLQGKISHLIKARFSKDLRAHVQFSGLEISLFRHFPKISITLDNLQVTCVGEFQDDTLLTAKQFTVSCDMKSLISGDSIRARSITVDEPRFHARINKYGHCNWDIVKSEMYPNEITDSSTRAFNWEIQNYEIHTGYLDYLDERRNMHIEVLNLEHEGSGNFSSEQFTLNTKTTAEAVHVDYSGTIPYRVTVKSGINLAFRVDNRTHTWSFNTDQISFNDLKLHSEGFFQWISESNYNMNIRFKVPSTKFKDFLSMMPSVYQKDFTSIETNGQVNFNGFIKGKYDEKHFPAYHANLYVLNGYFKYPDLPLPVEQINLGIQIDNPDGISDHLIVNVSDAHAVMNKDTLDLHLLAKNLKSKPFIDLALVGHLDLASISKGIKLEPGSRLSGLLNSDIHAKGIVPGKEIHKKDPFQSWGNVELSNFSWVSNKFPGGITLSELLLTFNSRDVLIKDLKGEYLATHIDATGTMNNLFDFALGNQPLNGSIDVKTDELNLREWIKTGHDRSVSASAQTNTALVVPDNIDFTLHAEAGKLHFDNLDLQNVSGKLVVSNEAIQLVNVKANGMDGDITMDGTYSTLESRESPEIALTYDVKGLDVQKTFFAFNTVRKIMPVAKFIAGNINAHMTLNGRLHEDMTTDLQTLYGEGNVELVTGSMKDFSPLDKLSQSLDVNELKDISLNNTKADFTFKSDKVVVSPFIAMAKDIEMEIGGTHGFDQSLEYAVSLRVPRDQLGSKGSMFVKNVVEQAANKGIPVKIKDAVSMNVKMGGTINSPDVKTDMDAVVDKASNDLNKEVNDFVNAKLDSAKQELKHPQSPAKKQLFVQTAYKSKSNVKPKKTSATTRKKQAHRTTKKKHKKSVRKYSTSLKKEKSTASNNR